MDDDKAERIAAEQRREVVQSGECAYLLRPAPEPAASRWVEAVIERAPFDALPEPAYVDDACTGTTLRACKDLGRR